MDDIESAKNPRRRSSHRSKRSKCHNNHRRPSKKENERHSKQHEEKDNPNDRDRRQERTFSSNRTIIDDSLRKKKRNSNKHSKQSVNDDLGLERSSLSESWMTSPSMDLSGNDSFRKNVRNYSKQEIEKQARDLDESFRSYLYAEKAATKIQLAFRERQEVKPNEEKSFASTETGSEDVKKTDDDVTTASENSNTNIYTSIFLLLFAIIMCIPKILNKIKEACNGQDDTGDLDAAANTALQPGGGGGAQGPTGGESGTAGGGAQASSAHASTMAAQAQASMAAQAATSAASGAASGVTAGVSAGVAVSSAATAAAATATAAGATQVATVVAVSTAAAAAATAGVAVSVISTPEPILSTCGLLNPDVRNGRFSMSFEGFPEKLEIRESNLLMDLVMDSYNEITLGPDVASIGCLDPLARSMESVSIVNENWTNVDGFSSLELLFEATVSCDRCSPLSPLFSDEQLAMQEDSNSQFIANTTNDDASTGNKTEATIQDTVQDERFRKLQGVSFNSQEFFQKLIQLVILETEELTDVGELPRGFKKVSKAWVVTNNEEAEQVLITEVQYERKVAANGITGNGGSSSEGGSEGSSSNGGGNGGSKGSSNGGGNGGSGGGKVTGAVFEFSFFDEDEKLQKVAVEVTDEGNTVPTSAFPTFQPTFRPTTSPSGGPTLFPTFQPTFRPTTSPSGGPTLLFSGQPTFKPSKEPSALPSGTPSSSPSDIPSRSPSSAPSTIPSTSPSTVPSSVPSFVPSKVPSVVPSASPSIVPSFVPSEVPSMVPSFVPSEVPSMVPSMVPSFVPSEVPSFVPSESPSMVPSFVPSDVPSVNPSSAPSHVPSMVPSFVPSHVPSNKPSALPSMAPTFIPCDLRHPNVFGKRFQGTDYDITIGGGFTQVNSGPDFFIGSFKGAYGNNFMTAMYTDGDNCDSGPPRTGKVIFGSYSSIVYTEPTKCYYEIQIPNNIC